MNRKFIQNSNLILRQILHSEENKDIIKDFIEAILKIPIKELQINDTPLVDGVKSKEYGIVDVRIETYEKEELNVGIQIIDGDFIQNKLLLYYAKIHSNQILYGDNRKIVRTITVNILDMEYFKKEEYHKIIKIPNNSNLEKIEMHTLELPKYRKNQYINLTKEDTWLMYLKAQNTKEVNIAKNENINIQKLDELLNEYWSKEMI